VSRLSRQCGILNISQLYRPPQPVTALLFFFFYFFTFFYFISLIKGIWVQILCCYCFVENLKTVIYILAFWNVMSCSWVDSYCCFGRESAASFFRVENGCSRFLWSICMWKLQVGTSVPNYTATLPRRWSEYSSRQDSQISETITHTSTKCIGCTISCMHSSVSTRCMFCHCTENVYCKGLFQNKNVVIEHQDIY
jgi:hypothetical protein